MTFDKVREEFMKILPPTIYFFVSLHIIKIVRILMLEGSGLSPGSTASIAVAAMVLGKSVLIADMLPATNRYPGKPLAYNIAWKSVLYFTVALLVHYLERLVDFWRSAGGFIAGNEKLFSEIVWPHFWAIQIILAILILSYCTISELVRLLGPQQARQIFFGPASAAAAV
jgi:hypothetical protein